MAVRYDRKEWPAVRCSTSLSNLIWRGQLLPAGARKRPMRQPVATLDPSATLAAHLAGCSPAARANRFRFRSTTGCVGGGGPAIESYPPEALGPGSWAPAPGASCRRFGRAARKPLHNAAGHHPRGSLARWPAPVDPQLAPRDLGPPAGRLFPQNWPIAPPPATDRPGRRKREPEEWPTGTGGRPKRHRAHFFRRPLAPIGPLPVPSNASSAPTGHRSSESKSPARVVQGNSCATIVWSPPAAEVVTGAPVAQGAPL